MPAVTVSITDHQREFVETEVQGGGYSNVSEAIRAALRLLEYQKRAREAKLRDLRAALEEGDTSGAPEPIEDIEAFLCRAHERRATRSQPLREKA